MRKIAFFGILGHSRFPSSCHMPHIDGLTRAAGDSLSCLLQQYEVTGNKGNMIHGEAITRILAADRNHSCWFSLPALREAGWSVDQICDTLNKNFDLVVFSTANAIRPGVNPGAAAAILEGLTTDFMLVGIGMQKALPPTLAGLEPKLVDLLDVCNRKARIFWARGPKTTAWLKSVGFDRATTIGCPSLFLYPNNTANIVAPDPQQVKAAVTGGYVQGRVPRSSALIWLFKDLPETHYVMQEEVAQLAKHGSIEDTPGLYNDATGEIDKSILEPLLESIHDEPMPFASYRWFQEPDAWRSFVSVKDVYVGDRLHGGAVALQTGVPAIMMSEDQRVSELAEFIGIPQLSIKEAESASLADILSSKLQQYQCGEFREVYRDRFASFERAMTKADIPITVGINPKSDSHASSPTRKATIPQATLKKRIRRLLRRL